MQGVRIEELTTMLKALLRRWVEGDREGFQVCTFPIHPPLPPPAAPLPTHTHKSKKSHCSKTANFMPF